MLLITRRPQSDSGQPPPPGPNDAVATADGAAEHSALDDDRTTNGHRAGRLLLARVTVSLAVATCLSSGGLITTAERLNYGTGRDLAITAAAAIDDHASALWLDRPAAMLRDATGRSPEPIQTPPSRTDRGDPRLQEVATSPALQPAPPAGGATSPATPSTGGPVRPESPPIATPPIATPAIATPATATSPAEPISSIDQPPARPVDEDHKLRVWAGGDSLGEYVGNHLVASVADPDLVVVELDYHISTGLARPDYFDWPERLGQISATESPPDAVLYMVGGNDNQSMQGPDGFLATGSDDWFREYEARVHSIVDAADPSTTHVYWIGLPPMRDADRDVLSMGMNDVVRRVADARPHVSYIDIEQRFTGPDGGYSPHIAAPDGQLRLARQADGVHVTFAGSTWIAELAWSLITDRWTIGATGSVKPDPRQLPN